jgi:hypothetical protein
LYAIGRLCELGNHERRSRERYKLPTSSRKMKGAATSGSLLLRISARGGGHFAFIKGTRRRRNKNE